tara:strand:- start:817 stop:1137 length:321 start_codon:yes stop_codon:yes gene_type:complete
MDKLISSSKISVAPMLSGSGQQKKIIESMALGIPVVTTTIAARPLNISNKKQLLIADTPKEFARLITKLLSDNKLHKELADNGREFVIKKYNWQNLVCKLVEEIYK